MVQTLSRMLLSVFSLSVAVAFAYLAWITAFAAMYASTPLLFIPALIVTAFVGVTMVWAVMSWFRRFNWVPTAYGWSSGLVFILVIALYAIDGLDLQRSMLVAAIGVTLYLNWQAMKLLHANAT
jgi:hypothetical protein